MLTANTLVQASGVHVGVVTLAGDTLVKQSFTIEATVQKLKKVLRTTKQNHFHFVCTIESPFGTSLQETNSFHA